MIEPQIIKKGGKPEFAAIPIAQWRRIQSMLEEIADMLRFWPQRAAYKPKKSARSST